MTTYRIKCWNRTFEDRRSREIDRLKYVNVPVSDDGEGFRMLMSTPEGVQAYGAFIAVVRIAARMKSRGVLKDERGPLTARRLAVLAGMPHEVMEKALPMLASDDIGWLEDAEKAVAEASEPDIDGENDEHDDEEPMERPPRADRAPTARRRSAVRAPQQCNGQCSLPNSQGNGQAVRSDTPGAREENPLPAAALPDSEAARGTAHCQPQESKPSRTPRADGNQGSPGVIEIATRLMNFTFRQQSLFDQGASSAIARELFRDRKVNPSVQFAWAVETMHTRTRTESIDNPAGYFRKLLLKERAPPEWIHEHQRKKAQELE